MVRFIASRRVAFEPLGVDGVKVSLKLSFELKGRILNQTFGRLFSVAADTMVDAFSSEIANGMDSSQRSIAIATPSDQQEIDWYRRCNNTRHRRGRG